MTYTRLQTIGRAFPASVAYSIIETAGAVLGRGDMPDSAALCLADARALFERGERFDYAAGRALHSISYSVGIFSAQYKHCSAAFEDARADSVSLICGG